MEKCQKPLGRLLRVRPAAEAGQAHMARATCAEALPRGDHDLGLFQETIEEIPAAQALRAGEPEVGGVISDDVVINRNFPRID